MATNTSNSTSGSSVLEPLPASQCIPWIVLLITECLAIVILNIITIIVFATQRQLQRRGTYLLIRNLAIVDLLAGGISGSLQVERIGEFCDVWEYDRNITWRFHVKFTLLHLFSMASLGNLVAISLERMHATFCPAKHFFMNKRVYHVVIALIWLTAAIREAIQIVLFESREVDTEFAILINVSLYVPYYLISLFIICVSYISIFIKIHYSPHPNPLNNGVTIRERQLTSTLFIVTVASILSLLPVIIFLFVDSFHNESVAKLSLRSYVHIKTTVVVFFLANSLANPIIYSMRMQGFRAGLTAVFIRYPSHSDPANLPLRRR